MTLASARERRDDARKLLANDTDPSLVMAVNKRARLQAAENTFEAVAREWYAKKLPTWAPTTAQKVIRQLEKDIFPWIGNRPIKDIAAPELLAASAAWKAGEPWNWHTACASIAAWCFVMLWQLARAERDPSGDLKGALAPLKTKHHASVTEPKKIGEFLRAIDGYTGSFMTKCALQLAPLVFVRPGELRAAEWANLILMLRNGAYRARK